MSAGIKQRPIIDASRQAFTRFWVNGLKAARTFLGVAATSDIPADALIETIRASTNLGTMIIDEFRMMDGGAMPMPEVYSSIAARPQYPELRRQFQDLVANTVNPYHLILAMPDLSPERASAWLKDLANKEAGEHPMLYHFIKWIVIENLPAITHLSVALEPSLENSRLQLDCAASYAVLQSGVERFLSRALADQAPGRSVAIGYDVSNNNIVLKETRGGEAWTNVEIDTSMTALPFGSAPLSSRSLLGVENLLGGGLSAADIVEGASVMAGVRPYSSYRVFSKNDVPLIDVSETPVYRAIEAANRVSIRAERFAWK